MKKYRMGRSFWVPLTQCELFYAFLNNYQWDVCAYIIFVFLPLPSFINTMMYRHAIYSLIYGKYPVVVVVIVIAIVIAVNVYIVLLLSLSSSFLLYLLYL